MTIRIWYIWVIAILVILSVGCSEEDSTGININPVFQKYVDVFIEAGRERGVEIDFSNTGLEIEFGSVDEDAGAKCSELGNANGGSHRIVVSESYWNEIDELAREVMIIHELGHCELGRIHDNQVFSLGDWKSIMRGSPLPSKDPAIHFYGSRKKYYLDELFNPAVDFPEWIRLDPPYFLGDEINKKAVFDLVNRSEIDLASFEKLDNYQIDLLINPIMSDNNISLRFGNNISKEIYSLFLDRGSKNQLLLERENIGILNILKLESLIILEEDTHLGIRKMGKRIDLFINGQFLYWLDGNEVQLNFLEIKAIQNGGEIIFNCGISKITI